MRTRVVALMGSYRKGSTIDQAVATVLAAARECGADTVKIDLVDKHVKFCQNCRSCCNQQRPGRGECVLDDDLDEVLTELESADSIVLAAPVNFADVNAMTRRFLERMVGYGYWPQGAAAPKARVRDPARENPHPRALLITSSAAPSLLTRWFAQPLKTLRRMARLLGARCVSTFVVGLVDKDQPPRLHGPYPAMLSERQLRKARRVGAKLVRA